MGALRTRFNNENLDRPHRPDAPPLRRARAPSPTASATPSAPPGPSHVLTDAPVVVYAVSGFADGRTVADPQPAEEAMAADATTAPAQAGLGHEAKGLADRVERALRKTVSSATELPS